LKVGVSIEYAEQIESIQGICRISLQKCDYLARI
jgi:hypothetical protein